MISSFDSGQLKISFIRGHRSTHSTIPLPSQHMGKLQNGATHWVDKGTTVMRPKLQGSRIMATDRINECYRILQRTNKEYAHAREKDPMINKYGCQHRRREKRILNAGKVYGPA